MSKYDKLWDYIAEQRGWQVGKISMKKQTVHFERTKD